MDIIKAMIEKVVYPVMEMKSGNCIRNYLKELKSTEHSSKNQLIAVQRDRLISLLCTCIQSVPAYQHLGLTEDEIRKDPYLAYAKIPVLTKKEYQAHMEDYINQKADRTGFIKNKSGGSTGEPVVFYMDRYAVEHYEAARWRGLSWWGITPGSRSVMIWGNPIELSENQAKKVQQKDRYLKNRITISAYQLKPSRLKEYVHTIDSYAPEYLYGYATALYAFAQLMQQADLRLRTPLKAVVSTSETLHDDQRKVMEEVYGCACVNEYGARDAGILGYECPQGHIHTTFENAIIELLNPLTMQPVLPGESGLICVSDLNNFSMPRLRYILGDMATYATEPCSCGLPLPVLSSLDGREDAILLSADGTLVHGNYVSQLTRKYESILKFQVIQHDKQSASAKVILQEQCTEAEATTCLTSYQRDLESLLPGVSFQMERVSGIPPSKSGKYRYTIREF